MFVQIFVSSFKQKSDVTKDTLTCCRIEMRQYYGFTQGFMILQ